MDILQLLNFIFIKFVVIILYVLKNTNKGIKILKRIYVSVQNNQNKNVSIMIDVRCLTSSSNIYTPFKEFMEIVLKVNEVKLIDCERQINSIKYTGLLRQNEDKYLTLSEIKKFSMIDEAVTSIELIPFPWEFQKSKLIIKNEIPFEIEKCIRQ